jgi:hypothetical protein
MPSRPDELRINHTELGMPRRPFWRPEADLDASFFSRWKKLHRLMMDLNPLASSCWRAADAVWLSEYGPT